MYTTTCQPEADICPQHDSFIDDDVAARVGTLIRALYASYSRERIPERRSDRRYPYPHLIRLLPVAADGFTPIGPAVVVVGKQLSERGLGFYHPEPLAHRRMVATLDTPDGQSLSLLIDLNWCRFTGRGWYESGGRFLEFVEGV